jgi:hypothetical protein
MGKVRLTGVSVIGWIFVVQPFCGVDEAHHLENALAA